MRTRARRAPRNVLPEGGQKVRKVSKRAINEDHLPELQDPAEEITMLAWDSQDNVSQTPQAQDNATQMPPHSLTANSTAAQLRRQATSPAYAAQPFHHWLQSLRTESSQRQLPHQVSPGRPTITFWSNDLHIAPIGDLKNLFGRIYPGDAMHWFDHSLSVYCVFTDTCVKSWKVKSVLNWEKLFTDVMDMNFKKIDATITQFYQTFRYDPDIQQVDAFVCTHFIYMCRLFVPFSKPIIADIPWAQDWMFKHLDWHTIFSSKYNVAVVNNGNLRLMSRAWTGSLPLKLVPNLCLYTEGKYVSSPEVISKPFLVMRKPWPEPLYSAPKFTNLAILAGVPTTFVQYQKGIKWKSIAEDFRAVVYCPYINSAMVFYETYNMNVPIAMPSMALAMVNGKVYGGHFSYMGADQYHAMDYYSGDYPHLIYWNSPAHLITILSKFTANDYKLISAAMAQRTAVLLKATQSFWEKQLTCILSIRNPALSCPSWVPLTASLIA